MPAHSRMPAVRRSYTLIELIIVMVVLALAAALLVPHLVGPDLLKAQAAVRLIIADLSYAQADALANQEYRRVHFYPDGRGYCLVRITSTELALPFDPLTAEYLVDPLGALRDYIVDFTVDNRFEGVAIETTSTIDTVAIIPNGTDITYDALGGTIRSDGNAGTGGAIVVFFNDERYEIAISGFTGKLTVRKL